MMYYAEHSGARETNEASVHAACIRGENKMHYAVTDSILQRRIRRAVENEFSRHERLTAELQQTLLAEQEIPLALMAPSVASTA